MLKKVVNTIVNTILTHKEANFEYLSASNSLLSVVKDKLLTCPSLGLEVVRTDLKMFLLCAISQKNVLMAEMFLCISRISNVSDLELSYDEFHELLDERENLFIDIAVFLCTRNKVLVDVFTSDMINDKFLTEDIVGYLLPLVSTVLKMVAWREDGHILGNFKTCVYFSLHVKYFTISRYSL